MKLILKQGGILKGQNSVKLPLMEFTTYELFPLAEINTPKPQEKELPPLIKAYKQAYQNIYDKLDGIRTAINALNKVPENPEKVKVIGETGYVPRSRHKMSHITPVPAYKRDPKFIDNGGKMVS